MAFKGSLNLVNNFFLFLKEYSYSIYLNSNLYNKKISSSNKSFVEYRPSPSLLDCLIKYDKKKINIKNYSLNEIWNNQNLKEKDYNNLNSFFWLFSLDLKSSKKDTQNIILQWIEKNQKYNNKNWKVEIIAKRIIAWISCSNLTYEDGDLSYKEKFNDLIKKQTNHLINLTKKSELMDNKMISCAAIILTGLTYQDKNGYLNSGLNLLKKILKFSFDNDGFPKSRSIKQLNFYLKYLILIREWLKESQN